MPDHFFIVGAQRSATTYLYHLCDEHPQIEMAKPVKPEPKFFLTDSLYDQGMEYYHRTFFSKDANTLLRGEKSTSYMSYEKVAQRIYNHFPKAKIIFLLRDPIYRAISHYWFSVKNGFETLPLEDAFLSEEKRWKDYDPAKVSDSPFAYLRRGRYVDFIQVYDRYFPRDQILVLLHEELIESMERVVELYQFLGVDVNHIPSGHRDVINANDVKMDVPFSHSLMSFLKEYYIEPNKELEKRVGRIIDRWQR